MIVGLSSVDGKILTSVFLQGFVLEVLLVKVQQLQNILREFISLAEDVKNLSV